MKYTKLANDSFEREFRIRQMKLRKIRKIVLMCICFCAGVVSAALLIIGLG